MRLDTAREETITNLSGSQKFKMNASAKAFQILSSGIYERKIEAIVRELSCNAYDSHVMAGKADVPFRIQLPTPINDFIFAIEDFGVGLSEDEVYNVYTTYFESTKTDSNDVIGALGLGSKTPFSYTDSFTVKARKHGKECVFSAQISASGEPEVVKMYERPWNGENGVEVSVEVASKDVTEFRNCADKVLSWFDVKPECNRDLCFDIEADAVANVRQYGYHLEPKQGFGRSVDCKVVMGNVAYDLNLKDLKVDDQSDTGKFITQLYNMRADVYFSIDIGDADVAASRETLSLDDRTKENLIQRLDFIRTNFEATTIAKVGSFANVMEAYNKLTSYERSVVMDYTINGFSIADLRTRRGCIRTFVGLADQDNPTATELEVRKILEDYDIAIYGNFGSWRTKPRSKREVSTDYGNLMESDYVIPVVINDCERKIGLKDALMNNSNLRDKVVVISDKKTTLTADLEKALNFLTFNSFKVIYASSFWDGKLSNTRSNTGGLAEETVKCKVMTKGSRYFVNKKVDLSSENKAKWAYVDSGSYFFDVEFSDKIRNTMSDSELRNIMTELDLDGVIAYNGNNKGKVIRILGESQDMAKLIEANASKACYLHAQTVDVMKNMHERRYMIFEAYESMYNSLTQLPTTGKVQCSKIRYERDYSTHVDTRKLEQAIEKRKEVFAEQIKVIVQNSPMLDELLTTHGFNDKIIPEVRQYIKMKRKGV
ncbi:MAG: putative protein rIIA [Prokaryotic dsDNA virus sp.]|jgi:hypothetical protein|nr:MAG: putative protein rIIA [Prokaryotic dsDNA virus sp.]|tara:strand:- start:39739 stop:41883 length:2145 start_codon:yes stop_codon:yes gene_type:complete